MEVQYATYWNSGLATAHFAPFCSLSCLGHPKIGTYTSNRREKDVSFSVRDSKKLLSATGTDCCLETVSAVYLKMVITALQSSYTYQCIIHSPSVNNLFQTSSSITQLFFSMLRVLNFWYDWIWSRNVTLRGWGYYCWLVIFCDLLEICFKQICLRIATDV